MKRIPITMLSIDKMIQLEMNENEIQEYLSCLEPIEELEEIIETPVIQTVKIEKIFKPRKPYTYKKKKSERKRKFYFPEHWDKNLIDKWRHYYYRSLKKQIEFLLNHQEFEDFFYKSQKCIYCGDDDSITIDRIDSSKGYVLFNVQACCNTCNSLKTFLPEKTFLKQIGKIYKHLNL